MTTPQEQADLDKLHADIIAEQARFSSLCQHTLDMSEDFLKHTGHKTKEAALLHFATDHQKTLRKLSQAHVKKWPD